VRGAAQQVDGVRGVQRSPAGIREADLLPDRHNALHQLLGARASPLGQGRDEVPVGDPVPGRRVVDQAGEGLGALEREVGLGDPADLAELGVPLQELVDQPDAVAQLGGQVHAGLGDLVGGADRVRVLARERAGCEGVEERPGIADPVGPAAPTPRPAP
jgi:hypothetical protein